MLCTNELWKSVAGVCHAGGFRKVETGALDYNDL